jgi:hypothetical protein
MVLAASCSPNRNTIRVFRVTYSRESSSPLASYVTMLVQKRGDVSPPGTAGVPRRQEASVLAVHG